MKRLNNKDKQLENLPVWTLEQSRQALPFISSVMKSIRQLFTDVQGLRRRAQCLDEKPGKLDRRGIIERDDALREADRLQLQLAEAANELAQLSIHCTDPIQGEAMVPFVNADELAWFVFDLFTPAGIATWRYHSDPLTVRRPLSDLKNGPRSLPLIA